METSANHASRIGVRPKCPMSANSASAPVTHRMTDPSARKAMTGSWTAQLIA